MTIINYYEALDSFASAKKDASRFQVRVDLKQGTAVKSSGLPIEYLPQMIATIETADAARTALSIWDREHKQIVLIPQDNILSVTIILD